MTYSQDFEKIELMLTAAGPPESVGRELQVFTKLALVLTYMHIW
jgi:hypothetical protein